MFKNRKSIMIDKRTEQHIILLLFEKRLLQCYVLRKPFRGTCCNLNLVTSYVYIKILELQLINGNSWNSSLHFFSSHCFLMLTFTPLTFVSEWMQSL